MYRIEKKLNIAIGHRLSKHKGLCKSIHGHNFTVIVGLKAKTLDHNDMVMDFSILKQWVNDYIKEFDHCLLINEKDEMKEELKKFDHFLRVKTFDHEPTAERLAENIFNHLKQTIIFMRLSNDVRVDFVKVYESEDSVAIFSEE